MFCAPHVEVTTQLLPIALGVRGVHQTLGLMRSLIDHWKKDPGIRNTAINLAFMQPERDELGHARAIFEYVRDRILYIRDVHDVETLHTPDKTLAMQTGDCDDQATLLCALLESIGYPTRLVVAGYNVPGEYEHVYAQVLVRGPSGLPQWIDMDATERQPLGYAPPEPVTLGYEAR